MRGVPRGKLSIGAMWRAGAIALALLTPLLPARASEDATQCCAQLEATLAQLDASVLRKGNSKVSLEVYGQVNRAILFWNDSFDAKSSLVDNTTSSSRLGLIGRGSIGPGLLAGYRLEFEYLMPASSEIYNPADVTHAQPLTSVALRQAYWYLSEDQLGTLSVGQQWSATGTLTLINLGSQMNDAALHYNNAFSVGLSVAGGIFSDLKWGQIAHNVDTLRGNYLRYDTPSLLGFVLSASVGEEESWDVALRYQANGQAFRFAAGIGYSAERSSALTELKGAASLLHHRSGLYASVASGLREDERSSLMGRPPAYFHYGQAGISKTWLAVGTTTAYADFGTYKNFNVGELLRIDPHTSQLAIWGTLAETEVVRWGYGVEQSFDASGLLVYAQAHHYQSRIVGFPCDPNPSQFANQCGGDPNNLVSLPVRPWIGYVVGMRMRF
jgi:hypothetical protein